MPPMPGMRRSTRASAVVFGLMVDSALTGSVTTTTSYPLPRSRSERESHTAGSSSTMSIWCLTCPV